jgi:hypothetical protein
MTNRKTKLLATCSALLTATTAAAKCGSVDYSWGADALARSHDYVVTTMLYVNYLLGAIAVLVGVISSLQIYTKMNSGEDGIAKDIMMLIGAILFIIGSMTVFPAMFGYSLN